MRVEKADEPDAVLLANGKRNLMQGSKMIREGVDSENKFHLFFP